MKCSDCKLWKTNECKNNPEAKDLNYAEAFACFVPTAEQEPISYVYTRREAIFSLVCGILSIVLIPWNWVFLWIGLFLSPFLGLIGIVVGAIYLGITRKAPKRSGKVMAIIGIICGSISVIVFGYYLLVLIIATSMGGIGW